MLFLEYLEQRPSEGAVAAFMTLLGGGRRGALLDGDTGESFAGLARSEVASFVARADAVISLAAHYRREPWPLLEAVRPRILVEHDLGYTHLWAAEREPAEIFGEHDFLFTVGASVGTPRSPIPTCAG